MAGYRIIDAHQHSGPWPLPGRWGGIEENLRLMALRGIDAAIVSSTRAVVQDMEAGNAELAEALAGHEHLQGYITLNPTVRDLSVREMQRYGDDKRFVGAKIHTHYSGCSMGDPRLAVMLDVVQEWGRPLLLHTWGAAEVAHLQRLAAARPRLAIIMAHAGGDAWRQGIAAAVACENLYLDFASSTPYRGAIARALSEVGAERIVFGTDSTLFDPLVMKSVFDHVPMSDGQRARVMGRNAARLFGIEG